MITITLNNWRNDIVNCHSSVTHDGTIHNSVTRISIIPLLIRSLPPTHPSTYGLSSRDLESLFPCHTDEIYHIDGGRYAHEQIVLLPSIVEDGDL